MIEDESVDTNSTIRRLEAAEAMYPFMARSHVLFDKTRYHHAVLVRPWLARPGRRISLRFIPSCCPRLIPIKRLWGLMHKPLTHNKHWRDYPTFAKLVLHVLSKETNKQWRVFHNSLTDIVRVIDLKDFLACGVSSAYHA